MKQLKKVLKKMLKNLTRNFSVLERFEIFYTFFLCSSYSSFGQNKCWQGTGQGKKKVYFMPHYAKAYTADKH